MRRTLQQLKAFRRHDWIHRYTTTAEDGAPARAAERKRLYDRPFRCVGQHFRNGIRVAAAAIAHSPLVGPDGRTRFVAAISRATVHGMLHGGPYPVAAHFRVHLRRLRALGEALTGNAQTGRDRVHLTARDASGEFGLGVDVVERARIGDGDDSSPQRRRVAEPV